MPDHDCKQEVKMDLIHEDLQVIKRDIREFIDRMSRGDVCLATVLLRIANLEKIVYGAVSVALLALITAIVNLIVQGR